MAVAALAPMAGGLLPTHAAAQSGTNVPVLVMLEDADTRSVVRTSSIAKRVLAELKRSMQDEGFRMVDEEWLAGDLGWKINVRRPKSELIQAITLANSSPNAAHHVRAQALFSIYAIREELSFANRIQVRIEGEVYDAVSRQSVGAWEAPRQSFPAPADCNEVCLSEIVGDHAREIATSVGEVLAKQLHAIAPTSADLQPGAPGTGAGAITDARHERRCAGMTTPFSLTFRRFTNEEVLQILNVMTAGTPGGFPCFANYDTDSGSSAVQRFTYVSSASAAKLREWLTLVLLDMGLPPGQTVEILVGGNEITLDKIVPRVSRIGGGGGGPAAERFQ
jgi:hypothetical protein